MRRVVVSAKVSLEPPLNDGHPTVDALRALPKEVRRLGQPSQLLVSGALQALANARIGAGDVDPARLGICLATRFGELPNLEHEMRQTGPRNEAEPDAWKLDADLFIRANPNTPCIVLSALLGAQGACVTLLGEGRDAIELALEAVAYGESDVVVAGAADSAVHTTGPKHASDEARMIVVLEEREHARRRGAPELMELEPGKELRL